MELPPPPPPPEDVGQDPSDATLVIQAQGGDSTAFDQLLVRYQKKIYGAIYNLTLNHEDTNDLLMETFEKAYRSIGGYKADASFSTWLYRIAVNRSINFIKRNRQKNHYSIDDADMDLQNRAEFMDTRPDSDPIQKENLHDLQNKLNESLEKLSEEHRAVVTLSDIEGLSHREIAQILGCSEGTIKSRLFHAHKNLQKYLKNYWQ
jgi:RNA polymerase sigma-70 factor, ECF subfamily